MKKSLTVMFFLFGIINYCHIETAMALPNGFVYLHDINPSIIEDIHYHTNHNFIGRPINGYEAPKCILTRAAAQALSQIQKKLTQQALSIKVYDCYRPQRAVDDFVAWSQDVDDQKMKQAYYPHVAKKDLFRLGYIAAKSGHTRGSTVDMTIVALDMGTHFDFLDPASHPDSTLVAKTAQRNRLYLQHIMMAAGFQPLTTEWWHFTLKNEPYPDTYFNFLVE